MEDLQIESVNPSKEGNLIMFRDSFANALIPFISESFGQVNYYRLFPYDYTKIESLTADTLVIEIAERNLNWFLQATPVLSATTEDVLPTVSSQLTMGIAFQQEKKSDMFFLNARFEDQLLAEKIIAVRLEDNGVIFEAFPIVEDSDIEDDAFELGFSIYTKNSLDVSSMSVYVLMDETWHKVIRP